MYNREEQLSACRYYELADAAIRTARIIHNYEDWRHCLVEMYAFNFVTVIARITREAAGPINKKGKCAMR